MADPTRLCVIIVSDSDADRLMRRLVEQRLPATKVSSTGGFLHRGSVTILSGVTDEQVDEVLTLVREECHARHEFVPVQTLPFAAEAPFMEPIEVRAGRGNCLRPRRVAFRTHINVTATR